MDAIRLGLVGCGGMGRGLCTQAVTLDDVSVAAVADINETRRAEAAEQYGAVGLADYQELVTRDDVDAVVVATPGGLHRPVVEAAAAAGKHVFSEKPLASFTPDCDAMIAAVTEAGVKHMVGQVCRYHPTHLKLKQLVDDGPLGQVHSIYVERIGGGWGDNHPAWRLSRKLSGGSLLEINAHELDWMIWITGRVKRVSASGGQYLDDRLDYPDATFVALTFENGACGVLQSTAITTLPSYACRLDCADGSAVAPKFFGGEITFKARAAESETETIQPDQVEVPVKAEMRAFTDAIRNDTPTPIPFEQARHTVAVAEAAYLSIETGQAIELS